MYLADRIRLLREAKNLSQGDIEARTGLLRCYISRVENGHTVPSLETLEKIARACEIKLYQLFYDGEEPTPPPLGHSNARLLRDWASTRKGTRLFAKIQTALGRTTEGNRELILHMALKMSNRKRRS